MQSLLELCWRQPSIRRFYMAALAFWWGRGTFWRRQIITHIGVDHLCDNRMRMLILNDFRNFKHKGIRVITKAWASKSGLSSTMAMSISPPSFLMRVVLPCCILFKIATALFSHRSVPILRPPFGSSPVCAWAVSHLSSARS